MISRRLKTDNRVIQVVASLAVATLLAGLAPAEGIAGDTEFPMMVRVSAVKDNGLSACGVHEPVSVSGYSSRVDRKSNVEGPSNVCVFFGLGDDAGSDHALGFDRDFDFDPQAHRGLRTVNGECDD